MVQIDEHSNKLSSLQLELLKSLKYMATEKQVSEIKSLLRFYFAQQLDAAIDKTESDRGYTTAIYESWLKTNETFEVKNSK